MLRKFLVLIVTIGLVPLLLGFTAESLAASSWPTSNFVTPAMPSNSLTHQRSGLILPTLSYTTYLPIVLKAPSNTAPPLVVLEPFESPKTDWQVFSDISGGGSIQQSSVQAAAGSYSARVATASSVGKAQIRINFSEPAGNHPWQERPGTWHWQWTNVYLPSTTVAQLGSNEYLTLAGLWPSNSSQAGWWLRVRQGGELYVYGFDSDGNAREFRVYGMFPQNQWVALEVGLHSQNGPGVKRAFAFLINGNFYGWYHQGRLVSETYDRAAMGILSTNSSDSLEMFVDQWAKATTANLPGGLDNRSITNLQEQDYRIQSGIQWQIDWSTWGKDLRFDPQYGLYSNLERLQSGRNLDRMPNLTSGWAEIEIDWPKGTPFPTNPNSYFGPMVGFRKEVNREENLEVIPIGQGNGNVNLVLEAWVNGGPQIKAQWPIPLASIGGGSHIPEPGDIIRTRWLQNASNLEVKASYYDASAGIWYTNIISTTLNVTNIGGIDFTDGYHTASSITIDSPFYSIRRYKVGTLDTYP